VEVSETQAIIGILILPTGVLPCAPVRRFNSEACNNPRPVARCELGADGRSSFSLLQRTIRRREQITSFYRVGRSRSVDTAHRQERRGHCV
jgi:hypothetical protein